MPITRLFSIIPPPLSLTFYLPENCSRIDELIVLNEALRKSLSLRLYNRVDNSGSTGKKHLDFPSID